MRRKAFLVCLVAALMLVLPIAAQADVVFQTINGTPPIAPGPFFWDGAPVGINNVGWYWTPRTNVDLTGIQTKLNNVNFNVNNNFTFTAAVYTERPANSGTLLDSLSFNGATFVDGPWVGGSFASPVHLTGGTQYFIGFTGWAAALGWDGPNSGAGVNSAAVNLAGDTFPGEEFLDGWFGEPTDWVNNFDPNSWPDGAILRFIAEPPRCPCPAPCPWSSPAWALWWLGGGGKPNHLLRQKRAPHGRGAFLFPYR